MAIYTLGEEVIPQLSFDTLFASILSRGTELSSSKGEGYETHFFQVFGLIFLFTANLVSMKWCALS